MITASSISSVDILLSQRLICVILSTDGSIGQVVANRHQLHVFESQVELIKLKDIRT
jgi:hypothetical protein